MTNEEFEKEFEKWFGESWKIGHRRRTKQYLIGIVVGVLIIAISCLI